MKCPHCGEEIQGIMCNACRTVTPEGAKFCMECGRPLDVPTEASPEEVDEYDLEHRVLCPDGTCTGIIVKGKCIECGRPYEPGQ